MYVLRILLVFHFLNTYHEYMSSHVIWLDAYTETDVDVYTKILDLGLPMPFGFVIPRSYLHSIFLNLSLQEKLIPLFEFSKGEDVGELAHVQSLVDEILRRHHISKGFMREVSTSYEHIWEHERRYLRLHVNDLHRAAQILRHIYAPPAVRVLLLPHASHPATCVGEASLVDTIVQAVASHIKHLIASGGSLDIQSILVQRVTDGKYSGYCETVNRIRSDSHQMVVYANHGAQILDEAGDVYLLQKDTMRVTDRHILTQPYKMVLKGAGYRKMHIHEEEGRRQVLPDSLIMRIGYLARDIERELYFPQKVSWTYEHGILYVTRLRSI